MALKFIAYFAHAFWIIILSLNLTQLTVLLIAGMHIKKMKSLSTSYSYVVKINSTSNSVLGFQFFNFY